LRPFIVDLFEDLLNQFERFFVLASGPAAWAIEGIDISDMPPLNPNMIPVRMLTTQ